MVAEGLPRGLAGCDTESNAPLPDGVHSLVLNHEERAACVALDLPDRLWFCAKEAVFKALYPKLDTQFEMADICIRIDPATSTFAASLRTKLRHSATEEPLTGRYLVLRRELIAAILD